MPIVHVCRRAGCNVLTMGEFCLEHETPRRVGSTRQLVRRIGPALAFVAAGAAAAFVRAHLPR